MQGMQRERWALAIVALGLLASVAGCGKEEKTVEAKPPAEVNVVKVTAKDTPVTFQYVAQTESSHQVEIRARVAGFLDKRVFTEGAPVKTGETLFLMDKKPFQAQLDGATASLARQKAAMETAKLNLGRVKPLVEQDALAKKQLDDATGVYESYSAAVEAAKAAVVQAELNLSYCTITSPVDGVTGAALVKDGAYVSPVNSHLTTVSVLTPIWVNFSVSEQFITNMRNQVARKELAAPKDNQFDVEVLQVDGTPFPQRGKITFTSPIFNPQTGTFLLRVTLDNPGGVLRPNQYVQARLHGATRPASILVPQRAVQQGAKGHFVWVIKDGKAENRPVAVGEWNGDDWFIREGLRDGEDVVVDGGLTLSPGAPVTVKTGGASSGEAPKDKAPKKGE